MPDYTSILRRSISALPDSSPEVREAVYQRARAALARQLTAVDPPLTNREIERQHHELEEAVARLEAELSPASPPARDIHAQRPEPPVSAAPQSSVPAPRQAPAPPQQAVPLPPAPPPAAAVPVPAASAPALQEAPARIAAARPEPNIGRRDALQDEADDQETDLDQEDEDEEDYEDDDRPSRLPLIAAAVALVALVGGAAAFGLAQREALVSMLGFGEQDQTVEAPAPGAAEPETPAAPPEPASPAQVDTNFAKRPDRLTNGGEQSPAEAPAEPETALVVPEEPEPPPTAEPPEPTPPPAESPPAAAVPAPPPPAEVPPGEQTAALEQPGQSIVAQRAIYYFQGSQGSPGQATEGTVAWTQISKDNSPAVQATLTLAERNVTATVTISRNTDSTLPASHLVEIQFTGDFGPSPIQRVPALVLKQTEQARGEPLNGAAVPVTEELFWIALADNQEQIARNLQLLREGSWFDIPILFNDGTRALITFEKGIPGDRVFETVMAGWTPS